MSAKGEGRGQLKSVHETSERRRTVVVNAESGILRATHTTVLVALAELERARSVLQLRRSRKQLCSVLLVLREIHVSRKDAPK